MAAGAAPTNMQKEQKFGLVEKEMEYRVDLLNRLTHTCFDKCIEKRHKDAELNMGENSCIDRCVSKYWQPGASGRVLPPVTGRSRVRVAVFSHCTGEVKACH
ncbi:mitochondrial import inner membrane translocase subunit TIM10-like [Miscanthus floridulus]|uniref:mitochondrial import inner membrane translocase subunit TIM10-like n=1 Tax=Miscanthus floridulus TaxID=154761 RepID=UPI00345A02A9